MICNIITTNVSNQTPSINVTINDLPTEIVKNILSFLPINYLDNPSLTCRSWEKISQEAFFDEILTYSSTLDKTKRLALKEGTSKIETAFDSNDTAKLNDFMHRCNALSINEQINFIENFILSASTQLNFKLLNHSSLPKVCKMVITEKSYKILQQFNWEGIDFEGLVPNNFKSFRFEAVPINYVSKLNISGNHTFQEGELVAVINKSILCFGRVTSKFENDNAWRISLQLRNSNQWSNLIIKNASEIGKFSKDCELPSFCS